MSAPNLHPFGAALEAVKHGARAARLGWNGKGMFIYLHKGSYNGAGLGFAPGEQPAPDHGSSIEGVSIGLFEMGDTGTVTRLPCLAFHTAHGSTLLGWLASQTDLLAQDWQILSP